MCDVGRRIALLCSIAVLIVAILFIFGLTRYEEWLQHSSIRGIMPWISYWREIKSKPFHMTVDELAKYNGEVGGLGLYIAILGLVYDVSKGARHYGPKGGYHGFAGRDASRAFVTGNFNPDGLTDNISGLPVSSYLGLEEWSMLYKKDYTFIGRLCGTFYDCDTGEPTEALHSYNEKLRQARLAKADEKAESEIFPYCNSHWKQNEGGYLWCSQNSGGVQRDWVGVPRQFRMTNTGRIRCACVRDSGPPSSDPRATQHNDRGDLDNPRLREYKNCEPDSVTCPLPES